MGFWLTGAVIWARFDHWLSLNHLVGFGRSIEFTISGPINEIKTIYILFIFSGNQNKCVSILILTKCFELLIWTEISDLIDRLNLTKWFRLNQWSNPADITAPASQKAKLISSISPRVVMVSENYRQGLSLKFPGASFGTINICSSWFLSKVLRSTLISS